MHLVARQIGTLDETASAIDLGQTPAECVFLSFSDSDLGLVAAVHETMSPERPSLRLANLTDLKHPFSVDLYLEKVAAHARFVIVRLLGGADYWRYGVDELASAARMRGFDLGIVPGDGRQDPRLEEASTLRVADLRRLWSWCQEGGPENIRSLLGFVAARLARPLPWQEPVAIAAAGTYEAGCRRAHQAPRALILLYRSVFLATDTAPIDALADALASRGLAVESIFVTSLKDHETADVVANAIKQCRPDIILNTTAFSARLNDGRSVLDRADAPVLQVALATASHEAWLASRRGLSAADLAMNIVLPEIDGRIITRAISFKEARPRSDALEFSCLRHNPEPSRVDYVADLASAWVRLRRKPRAERTIALVLSDYPAKGGRVGYAVGLDTSASVGVIAHELRDAGYDVGVLPEGDALMPTLESENAVFELPLRAYRRHFAALPRSLAEAVTSAWGEPSEDDTVASGAFRLRIFRAKNFILAVQPDRGRRDARKACYHDANLPPRHSYIAFYIWLREVAQIDALIHLGTHGTLEWLPGKAVALSADCAPEAVLGPLPVIYPFIVNDPGEAAQAKRRIAAVTIGHMTPPLSDAGLHGEARELEALLDEYAQAQELDPPRARMLADAILVRAHESGLAAESGLSDFDDVPAALARLDAWICDLKEMRVGDRLHVFGKIDADAYAGPLEPEATLKACARGEVDGLIAALDGRFVPPGPAGAPSRGRLDVLPTGRNLFSIDPRAVPTRTSWEIGRQAARAFVQRYMQDHGDYPRRILLDLWGSATMRTGGDDFGQALALLGVRPLWDHASARVSGFEIEPVAMLEHPRVDVTLRISGLFRDVFPAQIALFDAAVRAVAALDEDAQTNPLAHSQASGDVPLRIFGAAPGAYGIDFADTIAANAWTTRAELGRHYLGASSTAYSAHDEAIEAGAAFAARVKTANALLHVQDVAEIDVLSGDAFAEHEGGFFAAAGSLGNTPSVYHADATRPDRTIVRSLGEEIARVVRGRAANPRWIEGQMRHGYRGAAEIAEVTANLLAFAATTDAVHSHQFDLVYNATLGNEEVSTFFYATNPQAARALARTFEIARERGFWITRRNSIGLLFEEAEPAS